MPFETSIEEEEIQNQLDDFLLNFKEINRLAYKIEDLLYCLKSTRKALVIHETKANDFSNKYAELLDDDNETLNQMPYLIDEFRDNATATNSNINEHFQNVLEDLDLIRNSSQQLKEIQQNMSRYYQILGNMDSHRRIIHHYNETTSTYQQIKSNLNKLETTKKPKTKTRSNSTTIQRSMNSYYLNQQHHDNNYVFTNHDDNHIIDNDNNFIIDNIASDSINNDSDYDDKKLNKRTYFFNKHSNQKTKTSNKKNIIELNNSLSDDSMRNNIDSNEIKHHKLKKTRRSSRNDIDYIDTIIDMDNKILQQQYQQQPQQFESYNNNSHHDNSCNTNNNYNSNNNNNKKKKKNNNNGNNNSNNNNHHYSNNYNQHSNNNSNSNIDYFSDCDKTIDNNQSSNLVNLDKVMSKSHNIVINCDDDDDDDDDDINHNNSNSGINNSNNNNKIVETYQSNISFINNNSNNNNINNNNSNNNNNKYTLYTDNNTQSLQKSYLNRNDYNSKSNNILSNIIKQTTSILNHKIHNEDEEAEFNNHDNNTSSNLNDNHYYQNLNSSIKTINNNTNNINHNYNNNYSSNKNETIDLTDD